MFPVFDSSVLKYKSYLCGFIQNLNGAIIEDFMHSTYCSESSDTHVIKI
jgi:hypothetical protein